MKNTNVYKGLIRQKGKLRISEWISSEKKEKKK